MPLKLNATTISPVMPPFNCRLYVLYLRLNYFLFPTVVLILDI